MVVLLRHLNVFNSLKTLKTKSSKLSKYSNAAVTLHDRRQFHTSKYQDAKKVVIFDMGGVILPSPFGVAYSKYVYFNLCMKIQQ